MSEDLDWEKIADADIDLPSRDCCAAKDARISSLEQRVKELEEALNTALIGGNSVAHELIGMLGAGFAQDFPAGSDHNEVRERMGYGTPYELWCCWNAMMKARSVLSDDLCHADASRADSPHRADGVLQSDDGETQ